MRIIKIFTKAYCLPSTILTANNGTIRSHKGQGDYSPTSVCNWKISPIGDFTSIAITFDFIDLTSGSSRLDIYDESGYQLLGRFTGN